MKRLNIQIHPARSPALDVTESLARLSCLAADARVTKVDDDGQYANVDYKTVDPSGLWVLVRKELRIVPGLAETAIVVCEGQHGWDDYLLLHHYDPTEPLDELG